MRPILSFSILLSLAALVSCASTTEPITLYLLRGEPIEGTSRSASKVRAGIGRVIVAPYLLSAKGIMLETGDGQINPASRHQWAEPLDAGLRWYLRNEIGDQLGSDVSGRAASRQTWDYTVEIVVAQLHGTMSGTALIEADFALIPSDKNQPISEFRFSKSLPLPHEGYPGVVDAEKKLVSELAGLIADELKALMNP